jgi:hypothetical protein
VLSVAISKTSRHFVVRMRVTTAAQSVDDLWSISCGDIFSNLCSRSPQMVKYVTGVENEC